MELLFNNLDKLLDAPNGIEKARQLILQLAVQGKLTEQDPNDEPASELLKKIKKEKEKLIAEGNIKKPKEFPPIKDEEKPFSLPKSWEWVRLEKISLLITDGEHLSPPKTTSGMFLLTAKHIRDDGVVFDDPQYVSNDNAKKYLERCNPEFGDILICSRGTIGRCTVVNTHKKFVLMGSVILIKLIDLILSEYIILFLKTDYAQKLMYNMSGATAVKALYLKDIKNCNISIPSLNEQKRIVEKVNSLMALLDELEEKITLKRKTAVKLVNAVVSKISNDK